MALTLLVALAPPYAATARSMRDTTTPIIFVHGYSVRWLGSCPAVNAASWHPLQSDLAEDGWLGPKRAVGFYSCDTNVGTAPDDWIDDYGSHQVYYATAPCRPLCATHEWRHHDPLHHLSHTRNTDIRHLANHLAWYIYDSFTRYGTRVQIVAHSMGGLIVRWMIYAQQHNATIGQGVFPPTLYIQSVYTVSTPNNGMAAAWLGGTTQTAEMFSRSAFIAALNSAGGRDPQATGGTTWTTMGNYPSDSDYLVSAASATHMDGRHKVLFDGPTRYSHGGSLNDMAETEDAHAYLCDGCPSWVTIKNPRFVHSTHMLHNDAYVAQAFMVAASIAAAPWTVTPTSAPQGAPATALVGTSTPEPPTIVATPLTTTPTTVLPTVPVTPVTPTAAAPGPTASVTFTTTAAPSPASTAGTTPVVLAATRRHPLSRTTSCRGSCAATR
jgi:hypothetical protein